MPKSRSNAGRATAARVRAFRETGRYEPIATTKGLRQRQRATGAAFAERVRSGQEPYPAPGTPESKQLARYGSLAKYNKADPRFLAAFEKYFYHKKGQGSQDSADAEEEDSNEDEDEE